MQTIIQEEIITADEVTTEVADKWFYNSKYIIIPSRLF